MKSPFFSRTIWLNAVGFLLSAAALFFPQVAVAQTWLTDPTHLALIGAVWSGVNIVLRFVTKDKIQLGD